ncbi:MAG: hydroxymethylglutaryl-CoA lyase [Flavobacteriales bacterium]|mgnify:CR=1 FL=1|nr:hydroxymethylglutaryl-CoA lyase [Flavobacteriales bacterium]
MHPVHLVECPRDAIQGWPSRISTEDKVAYYKTLLEVGFHTIDLGSFVSHKAVPQMKDTRKVLQDLEAEGLFPSKSNVLVIVANERGAKDAAAAPGVTHIGFPMSISETFQLRNTGADLNRAWERLRNISDIIEHSGRKLVVYLSMGFGNPYNDDWSINLLMEWVAKVDLALCPDVIALSDTIGNAYPDLLRTVFTKLTTDEFNTTFGAHLHAKPWDAQSKIQAAWDGGCRRFDGALGGIGGCPMAQDELVGNLPTEALVSFLLANSNLELDSRAWNQAQAFSVDLFR